MIFLDCIYRQMGSDSLIKKGHTHEGKFEIIQTLCDDGNIMIKDKLYPMSYGSVYFINAIDNHCAIPFHENKYIRNKLLLNSSFVKNLFSVLGEDSLVEFLFAGDDGFSINLSGRNISKVDGLFKQISGEAENPENSLIILSLLFQLFDICIKNFKSASANSASETNTIMQGVLTFINNNHERELSLEEICQHVPFSKYYLCHEFKRLTNMTIMQYLKERRLSISKKKLIDTNETISNIALSTGFKSFSYFSRFFKEETGMTPKDFRKRFSNKNN